MTLEPAAATEFPVVTCVLCAREVLCWIDLDERDDEVFHCVECDSVVDPAAVRWLDLHGVEELGYGYVVPEGGCGRPDCGKGRCGRAAPDEL